MEEASILPSYYSGILDLGYSTSGRVLVWQAEGPEFNLFFKSIFYFIFNF
jgi:hypothetical protein